MLEGPVWVEPSFCVYYLDMVYSEPRIVEADFLLAYPKGYIFAELKNKMSTVAKDSLKFLIDGLSNHVAVYFYKNSSDIGEAGMPFPMSFSQSEILQIIKRYQVKEVNDRVVSVREEAFSIDNFLSNLIVYGSPRIVRFLTERGKNPLEHLKDLLEFRIRLLRVTKGLEEAEFCDLKKSLFRKRLSPFQPEKMKGKAVVLFPAIENENLVDRLGRTSVKFLKGWAKDVVVLYTQKSKNCAQKYINCLKNRGIKAGGEEVGLDEWAERTVENAGMEGIILLVGEVPKSVLRDLALGVFKSKVWLITLHWGIRKEELGESFFGDVRRRETVELVPRVIHDGNSS